MSHESFCLTTADKGLARICFGKADSLIDSLMFLSVPEVFLDVLWAAL